MRTLKGTLCGVASSVVLPLLLPLAVSAQVTSERGTATAPFNGPPICSTGKGVDKGKRPVPECLQPTAAELRDLQRRAALNALERFVARDGEATQRSFERVRDSASARFEQLVIGVLELSRTIDSTTRQVTINVRADISEATLRDLLRATSAVASASTTERSLMGMFMLARSQSSTTRFDSERRTNSSASTTSSRVNTADSTRAVREAESLKGGVVTLDDRVQSSQKVNSTTETNSGTVTTGSSMTRANQDEFSVAPAQDLESAIGSRLNVAGYEPVEGALLEDDGKPALLEAIRADFGAGDDLKATTLRRMLGAAQKQEVRYVLVGFVEAGLPTTDAVSGSQRVSAKVTAKVYDLSGRLPRTVVTVGPALHAGLGPDASTARTNAIKSAADETARAVINQLSNRQVK